MIPRELCDISVAFLMNQNSLLALVLLVSPIKNGAVFEQGHTLAMLHLIEHLAKVALLFQLAYSINKSSVTPLSLHVATLGF